MFIKKILLVSLAAFASNVFAWGADGHQIIALIAQSQLTSNAKVGVARLLALEPGETLASLSTWADEHRNPASASWHYINFPRENCFYDEQRDCPEGRCVVGAIRRQFDVFLSKEADEKRLMALKYLIHLVADVHQPLHAGYLDDKGGNKYQLQTFMNGSNLHALWDSGLIRNQNEAPQVMAERLSKSLTGGMTSNMDPVRAAEESCVIVGTPGFYPERKVELGYFKKFTPVMELRLITAGARLAGMLNQAFK